MTEKVTLIIPGPSIGSFVKVSRHGESLWLEVKQVKAGKKIVATIANNPIFWPYSMGDAVEVEYDEVIGYMPKPDK